MAKYKYHTRKQTLLIPVVLDEQLQPGTLEHTIDYLIDNKIDLSIFDRRYNNDEVGRPAWDPSIMLKVILFAYSRGINSSRTIARACRENVTFMALSDQACPHYTTIADFITTMDKEITEIFQKVLLICSELDLTGGEMLAIDGCKLSSNTSKEWSGTKKQLKKKKEKFESTIKYLIKKHKDKDGKETKDAEKQTIDKLQKKVEKIDKFLNESEDKIGKRGRILQSNITDNESAKMQTSHGMVQGYNGLALVDSKHQIIVHAEAFGSGPEQELLTPMLNGARKNIKASGISEKYLEEVKLLGDTGFHTEDNIKELEENNIDAYIPDTNYRKRDPRFIDAANHKPISKKKRFTKEDFKYNKDKDIYYCPARKSLKLEKQKAKIGNSEGRRYKAAASDCKNCKLKRQCLRTEQTKQRYLFIIDKKYDRNYSETMKKKIDTPESREIYSHRMGIVEPVFGNIRSIKRLDRFTLRTKVKVTIQWMLYALVHNIEKICNYGFAYR